MQSSSFVKAGGPSGEPPARRQVLVRDGDLYADVATDMTNNQQRGSHEIKSVKVARR